MFSTSSRSCNYCNRYSHTKEAYFKKQSDEEKACKEEENQKKVTILQRTQGAPLKNEGLPLALLCQNMDTNEPGKVFMKRLTSGESISKQPRVDELCAQDADMQDGPSSGIRKRPTYSQNIHPKKK